MWVTLLDKGSAWGSAFDHAELMRASVGYDDRSPDEVLAEQKRRSEAGTKKKGKKPTGPPPMSAGPRKSEVDKMFALLARGQQAAPAKE